VLRFCEIAVDIGFIDEEQVRDSLEEQIANDPANKLRSHRLIGEILLKNGWLTNEQIDLVLAKLKNPQNSPEV
jgi:hypothetical protein